ncbi:MarC family protein [Pyrobaculum ferrireducens]|uniref:MarC family protein n=1 Tax=Pyrobaculum ferrireducens TaxID=1104324 RepID=UPI0011E55777|nr:MarC family protein [Pyrobaculum ferrireducens]
MTPVEFLGLVGQLYAIMNPIGKLAIVGPLAVEKPEYVRKITIVVVVTVYILSSIFALSGGVILAVFGVSIDSFRIAGGIVLMAISIMTLVSGSYVGRLEITEEQAVVPLATPLIVGPGTITALIIMSSIYGPATALAVSVTASTAVAATLLLGIRVVRYVGATPMRLLGRFMSLIIASVATEMILTGVKNHVARWMS